MVPIIYNLFPRLAGTMDSWLLHAERAWGMGFGWIYLNPVTLPGLSGSLYSVKDYYKINPDFLPPGSSKDGLSELRRVLGFIRKLGMKPVMDLVINHTAIDSPLLKAYPDWYVRDEKGAIAHPYAIDPADARRKAVWGDLAEIDNEKSTDLDHLWDYWRDLVRFYVMLGFEGFRCDTAYKVPAVLWRMLTDEARERNPDVIFFAETLGCRFEQVSGLSNSGLDYLFNSSKFWNFDQPWALEQHEQFGKIAPSISFPESHDTPRLFAETRGNRAVQRQRYLLAAIFSGGVMMPIGYEFGFQKPLNVVSTAPDDWEDSGVDFRDFIREVNRLKQDTWVLQEEGHWRALGPCDRPTLLLEKRADDDRVLVLINKDWDNHQTMELEGLEVPAGAKLRRVSPDGTLEETSVPQSIELNPAEILLVW